MLALAVTIAFAGLWVGCSHSPRLDPAFAQDDPVFTQVVRKTVLITSTNVDSVELSNDGGHRFTFTTSSNDQQGTIARGCLVTSEGLILTAAHNLDGTPFKVFVLIDGHYRPVDVEIVSRGDGASVDTDFALIRATGMANLAFFEIGTPSIGLKMMKYGYYFATGSVSDVEITATAIVMTCDASAAKGESGGPVVDYQGRLLGINSRYTGFTHQLMAVLPSNLVPEANKMVSPR